jgi:hypothetical protein
MIIHYAEINSDSGPFVFIRLLDSVDQQKYEILEWAQRLSRLHFDGRPIAVANRDENNQQVLQVWPASFASVLTNMSWAGIGLSTASVDDIPISKRRGTPMI